MRLIATLALSVTHSGHGESGAGWQLGIKETVGIGDEGQIVEAAPQHRRAWMAIPFAAEETANLGYPAMASRRLRGCWGDVGAVMIAIEGPPSASSKKTVQGMSGTARPRLVKVITRQTTTRSRARARQACRLWASARRRRVK